MWYSRNLMVISGCQPGKEMEFEAQVSLMRLIRKFLYHMSIQKPNYPYQTSLKRWNHQNKRVPNYGGAQNSKEVNVSHVVFCLFVSRQGCVVVHQYCTLQFPDFRHFRFNYNNIVCIFPFRMAQQNLYWIFKRILSYQFIASEALTS